MSKFIQCLLVLNLFYTQQDSTHNKEVEQLQSQLSEMKERVSILRQQLDDEEAEHKRSVEDFQEKVSRMKEKHKATLVQAENEYKVYIHP